jgi:3-methyl-2-oxobutanoate hydroxymethyltransferase
MTKVTIPFIQSLKGQRRFAMLTAYDAPFARLVDESGVEMILVGDMPFLSYQADPAEAIRNAGRLVKEAGVDCVKLEGTSKQAPIAKAIVDAGIAVIGHIGLTPQTAASLGGINVIGGQNFATAQQIVNDALAMQAAGCWCVLMEAVPADLAAYITKKLTVPTIGIGAGIGCDGQVLVTHEMFGMFPGFGLPFGKRYAEAGDLIRNGMQQYHHDVLHGTFPEAANSFPIDAEMIRRLEAGE